MIPEQDAELDVRQLANVLRRRGWLIIVLVAVAVAGTYAYSARQPNLYQATAKVQVRDPNTTASDPAQVRTDANREVSTQLQLIQSADIRSTVHAELGSAASAVKQMSASNITDTDIIEITVTSQSPEAAADAADTFATVYVHARRQQLVQVFQDQATELRNKANDLNAQADALTAQLAAGTTLSGPERSSLQAQYDALVAQRIDLSNRATNLDIAAAARSTGVAVIEEAPVPTSPVSPRPSRDAAIAGAVALILGVCLVFLLERIDDRVGSIEQVEALTGVSVVGTLPLTISRRKLGRRRLPKGPRSLVAFDSTAAEAYRTLQTNIRFSSLGKAKQTILMTSPSSGEGKSTCTANLASMLADSGLRVVVVSADLRKPAVASVFGLTETDKGLTSVLLGDASLVECLVPVALENGKSVYVLPAGPLCHNPAELLGSQAFGSLLDEIAEAGADFILVDCAPVLPVSDPLAAVQHVDGVLVLSVPGQTHRGALVETVGRLQQVGADIIGVVLNGVPTKGSGYSYYYQYGYGNAPRPLSNGSSVPVGDPAAGRGPEAQVTGGRL